jgi:hypothetical protein
MKQTYILSFVIGASLGLVLLAVAFAAPPGPRPPDIVAETGGSSPQTPAPPEASASTPGASPSGRTGVPDRVTGPVLPAARPVSVEIPRLHVSSRLELLGVDAVGEMEVPQDPARAGWYALGPTPGALGPAVIAGHVTWNQVPAVFSRLAELRPGDLVRVARADGRVAVFEVTRTDRYEKSRFPTSRVFGAIDHAALRLITCGGEYDSAVHRYSDNVVVYARLTGS